ncbi:hypothetical protein RDV89_13730 [Nocardioides zeae]|uniref:DUF2993 domain-containing protein n=1 Tax=Nocardioides imazamoxiresistens TaxID=3231893 RepID=A0ABU3PY11_9ACTN|nr:LmeA family phospholipid-binding protein [Nocardioides zeae]MDT9594138.1 hypothetical protein [Nocardioides zeae]
MPLPAAVLVVGATVAGVVALVAGALVAARARRRPRRLVAGSSLALAGAVVLVLVEVLPRAYAVSLPGDDACVPDDLELSLARTPVALQLLQGELRGTAELDRDGLGATVADALEGTALRDPEVRIAAGEVTVDAVLPISIVDVPLSATVVPTVQDGALTMEAEAFSVVGLDLPDWAVSLVDEQVQDADSALSQAVSPGDDACDGGAGAVRVESVTVTDGVRIDFALPVG